MKMGKEWTNIFISTDPFKIELIKGMLKEHCIHAVTINKKDSSYLVFGTIELYVMEKDANSARQLIDQQQS